MPGLSKDESRAIQSGVIERKHPNLKNHLYEGEVLLAFSERKPKRITGIFCIFIGVFSAAQMVVFFLLSNPLWALLALFFAVVVIWFGVWIAFFIGNEYVFVSSNRIAHQRVNYLGKRKKDPFSIPMSEVSGVHFFRGTVLFSAITRSEGGDILVKKISGGTYLVPSLKDSVSLSEVLIGEIALSKKRSSAM